MSVKNSVDPFEMESLQKRPDHHYEYYHKITTQIHENASLLTKEGAAFVGKAEMLQMRHWIIEMSEELKIKRKDVIAAEARVEVMAEQLLSLQIQKDSQEQEAKRREEALEQSLAAVKQQCEDRLKQMRNKEIQHQSDTESSAHIQEKAREERMQLKATIRQREKQLRELEAQLQMEKSASSKLLSQWKETEVKFEELCQLHQICQRSLARLEEAASQSRLRRHQFRRVSSISRAGLIRLSLSSWLLRWARDVAREVVRDEAGPFLPDIMSGKALSCGVASATRRYRVLSLEN
ncbi:hypothetical protein ElyMa_005784200 [Elysia marginata]|uniref:Uncharacterized protein n=1 Tax=Elysia marginata TaxID=1093978 RepID=A0AAV4FRR0_9GAST|nr:hypothetical protein ElyMa_005784200 [Elysia marginata]